MNAVTVKKEELLEKLRANRSSHRDVFLKAQEEYRAEVIVELDKMLEDARGGRRIRRMVALPEPEDHTADYDRVIAMLEMSVGLEIEISEHEFQRYVLDQWEWAGSFAANTLRYTDSR